MGDIFQNSTVIQDEQLKEFIPPLLLGIRDLFGILQQLDNLPENTKNTFDSITHFADLAFTRFKEGPPRQNYMIDHLKKPAVAKFFYGKPDRFSGITCRQYLYLHMLKKTCYWQVCQPTQLFLHLVATGNQNGNHLMKTNMAPIGTLAKELHDVATASSQSHILTDKTIDYIKSIQADKPRYEEASELLRKLNDIVIKLNQQIEGQKTGRFNQND